VAVLYSVYTVYINIIPTKKRREFLDLERMRVEEDLDQNEGIERYGRIRAITLN
jgi:hypothetical protein